jgi:arylsulfatase A-like enzyme
MSEPKSTTASAGGVLTTLRAALDAGLAAGAALGLLDGVVAGVRTGSHGFADTLGCLGASAVVYGLFWIAALGALGVALHPLLRSRPLAARLRALLAIGVGLGLALDLYWWSRPWIYPGVPATDPRRLAVAAGLAIAGLALGSGIVAAGRRAPRAALWSGAAMVVLAWVGGVAYLAAQKSERAPLGELNERNRDLPNVLFFMCDAMRTDALGCYGGARARTPRIDALAADGVLFERALVQAPFTGSSFGSYFTGKYPRRHGFVKMTADARMAANVTLASHLKGAPLAAGGRLEPVDYHCIAFMTGALSHASGLARGFDSYYEAFAGHDLVHVASAWSVFRSELTLAILRAKLEQRLGRGGAADAAVSWLRDLGSRRFFALVHLYSTHTPYDPPADLREQFCDPGYEGPVTAFRSDHREAIEAGRATPTPADVEQIRNLYYAGAAHDDRRIGAVLDELDRRGALANTIVIVAADHGEELGEHGVWEHNHMFQTNLRVPLIVSWPAKLPRGARVTALVESVDLLPSLCELIGLAPPFEERLDDEGRNYGALDGTSFLPLVRGERDRLREHSFAENGLEMAVQDAEWKLIVPAVPLAAETIATLAANPIAPPRLFHLAVDPDERANVIAEYPERAEALLAVLRAWDESMPIPRTDIVQSARDVEQARRRLRELGYGDGVGQGAGEEPRSR